MIDRQHPLSVVAQCKLLGVPWARVYRLPTPPSAAKLDLMRRIDRLHMEHPHMGSRSIQAQLNRQGIAISRGRVIEKVCALKWAARSRQHESYA